MVRSYRNDAGLSEEHLTLLEEDLGQLGVVAPDLPDALLRYVLDYEGEESLQRLATTPPEQIPVAGFPGVTIARPAAQDKRARMAFFAKPAVGDPRLYLRLVRVYQAIWRHNGVRMHPVGWQSLAEAGWLEPFLVELQSLRANAREHNLPPPAGVSVPLLDQMLVQDGKHSSLLIRALLAEYDENLCLLEMFLVELPGFGQWFMQHSEEVIAWLDQAGIRARLRLLELLSKTQEAVHSFLAVLVKLAVCRSKTVRDTAAHVLETVPTEAMARVRLTASEETGDERVHAAVLLNRLLSVSERQTVGESKKLAEPVPVESLRGLEDDIFGDEGKTMAVHAAFDEVRGVVKAIRGASDLQWGIWLVQLRGHQWAILKSDEPLGEGVVTKDSAKHISRELCADVVYCLTENTSGVIEVCIFRAGVPLLAMDNLDGIADKSPEYLAPPQDPDEESDDFEFDVRRHLDHYLETQGTYLPSIWPRAPTDAGVGVTARGLNDADFERVEYIASYA